MTNFARLDSEAFPDFAPGSVWLVGAGPGAPGLMTLIGYHGLASADVVVHDALVADGLLRFARADAEIVDAGKRGGRPSPKQADITEKLIAWARAGKRVCRLKGGDPFMFGRGGEEAGALHRAGIPFRVVPGISAGLGGLAYAGIPVTHRDANHAVLFLTGHDESGEVADLDWEAVSRAAPVLVLFMAVRHLRTIAARLVAAGRDPFDHVAIAADLTRPGQTVIETRLGEVGELETIPTPAVVVIGPTAGYREVLGWYAGDLKDNPLG
jgi:uroporphyrin-III C-methyltransferase